MSLRAAMPETAAFIDSMRDCFGRAEIDDLIRRGLRGEQDCFHATEAGHEVGTAFRPRQWFDARPSPSDWGQGRAP